jgi:hypothetical protein
VVPELSWPLEIFGNEIMGRPSLQSKNTRSEMKGNKSNKLEEITKGN